MKKILCAVMILVLMFSFSACGSLIRRGIADALDDASNSQSSSSEKSSSSSNGKASSPSDSYGKYTEMKGIAYEKLNGKIYDNSEVLMTVGMTLMPIAFIDLTLIPLTMIGSEGGAAALAMLGMQNVDIKQNGNTYTVTYNTDESTITQTCEYDASSDSIRSVMSEDGNSLESLVFEYARSGDGYVSQYATYEEEKGGYSLIKMYFNADGDMTLGVDSQSGLPDSIYKKSGLGSDFAKNDSFYLMLDGDSLTVLSNGETKTY